MELMYRASEQVLDVLRHIERAIYLLDGYEVKGACDECGNLTRFALPYEDSRGVVQHVTACVECDYPLRWPVVIAAGAE